MLLRLKPEGIIINGFVLSLYSSTVQVRRQLTSSMESIKGDEICMAGRERERERERESSLISKQTRRVFNGQREVISAGKTSHQHNNKTRGVFGRTQNTFQRAFVVTKSCPCFFCIYIYIFFFYAVQKQVSVISVTRRHQRQRASFAYHISRRGRW